MAKELFNGTVLSSIADDLRIAFGKPGQVGSFNARWDAIKSILSRIYAGLSSSNTFTGTNIFTGKVVVPIPVDDNDAVTKKFAEELIGGSAWEVVEIDDQDFTAENFKIYIVNTSDTARTCTIPDANGTDIQVRIYKKSSITTQDVLVKTTSNQLIGGSTSQLITGQSEGIWVVGLSSSYEIVQSNRGGLQKKLSQSTGGIFGFEMTKNPDNTVNFAPGYISIEKIDSLESPQTLPLRFDGQSNITVTNANTSGATLFYIDDQGNITQSTNTPVTDSGFRYPVRIGIAVHLAGDGTIDYAFTYFVASQNPSARLSSLMNDLGVIKTGVKIEAITDTSQIKNSSGTLRAPSIRTQTVPNAPDTAPIISLNPIPTLTYFTRTLKQPSLTAIDFGNYNPTGDTIEAVPGNNSACSPIYVFSAITNEFFVQYGQNVYASVADAINAYTDGSETLERHPTLNLGIATLAAVIFVSKGSTNLNTAIIRQGGKIQGISGGGGGGTAIVSLQDALENSTSPQMTVNEITGEVQIKSDRTADSDVIFSILNKAGTAVSTFFGNLTELPFLKNSSTEFSESTLWEILNNAVTPIDGGTTIAGTDVSFGGTPGSPATAKYWNFDNIWDYFFKAKAEALIPSIETTETVTTLSELTTVLTREVENLEIFVAKPISGISILNVYPKNVKISGCQLTVDATLAINPTNYSECNVVIESKTIIDDNAGTCVVFYSGDADLNIKFRDIQTTTELDFTYSGSTGSLIVDSSQYFKIGTNNGATVTMQSGILERNDNIVVATIPDVDANWVADESANPSKYAIFPSGYRLIRIVGTLKSGTTGQWTWLIEGLSSSFHSYQAGQTEYIWDAKNGNGVINTSAGYATVPPISQYIANNTGSNITIGFTNTTPGYGDLVWDFDFVFEKIKINE